MARMNLPIAQSTRSIGVDCAIDMPLLAEQRARREIPDPDPSAARA
jgi:hypothetical protein